MRLYRIHSAEVVEEGRTTRALDIVLGADEGGEMSEEAALAGFAPGGWFSALVDMVDDPMMWAAYRAAFEDIRQQLVAAGVSGAVARWKAQAVIAELWATQGLAWVGTGAVLSAIAATVAVVGGVVTVAILAMMTGRESKTLYLSPTHYAMTYGSWGWWADLVSQGLDGRGVYVGCSRWGALGFWHTPAGPKTGQRYDSWVFDPQWEEELGLGILGDIRRYVSFEGEFVGMLYRLGQDTFKLEDGYVDMLLDAGVRGWMKPERLWCRAVRWRERGESPRRRGF